MYRVQLVATESEIEIKTLRDMSEANVKMFEEKKIKTVQKC